MKIIQSALFLLFCSTLLAQFEPSAEVNLDKKMDAYEYNHLREYPLRNLGEDFFELRFDKDGSRLVKYSLGLNEPEVIILSTEASGISGDVYFADLFELGDKYVGVLRENLEGKNAKFYFQELDKEAFKLIGKPMLVAESSEYRMGWWDGEYLIGSPEYVISENGQFMCLEIVGLRVEGKSAKKLVLYDNELNLKSEYQRLIEDFEDPKFSGVNVTDKGRILELVKDFEYWKSYRAGAKNLPASKEKLMIFYEGGQSAIALENDGELIRTCGIFNVENEKLYGAGTYTTFKEKKSKTPGEAMISQTVIDLEKEEGEQVVVNESFRLVYNDLNKYMSKEDKEESDKFFNKRGYRALSYYEIGSSVSNGVLFLAFRRTKYYNSDNDLSQCITVLRFEDFTQPPQIGFLPMNSLIYDEYFYVANGKPYFLVLTESSNVTKKFNYNDEPKKLAHYSKNVSFCLAEVGFGENSGYSFKEFENSENFNKAKPQINDVLFLGSNHQNFSVLFYKTSSTGYSQEHFRFYSVEYND